MWWSLRVWFWIEDMLIEDFGEHWGRAILVGFLLVLIAVLLGIAYLLGWRP